LPLKTSSLLLLSQPLARHQRSNILLLQAAQAAAGKLLQIKAAAAGVLAVFYPALG
jgi:hypothetical protein